MEKYKLVSVPEEAITVDYMTSVSGRSAIVCQFEEPRIPRLTPIEGKWVLQGLYNKGVTPVLKNLEDIIESEGLTGKRFAVLKSTN